MLVATDPGQCHFWFVASRGLIIILALSLAACTTAAETDKPRPSIIAEPQTKYVVEEKQDEDTDDDDESGPDDPTRHLHRQAAKIRRGERLDTFTALLGRQE